VNAHLCVRRRARDDPVRSAQAGEPETWLARGVFQADLRWHLRVAKLFEIAALVTLGGHRHSESFRAAAVARLAYVSLSVHSLGYGAACCFFGFCCVLFGYLIRPVGILPRILGTLLVIGVWAM